MERLPLSVDNESDPPKLLCPLCGDEYIHHNYVEVYNREEDAKTGMAFKIRGTLYEITNVLTGNPSYRRHGIIVGFWCEKCGGKFEIHIVQHKGETWFYGKKIEG